MANMAEFPPKMTQVPWEKLLPGTTYYIQSIYNNPGKSGKKVGIFDKIEDKDGTYQIFQVQQWILD